MNELQPVCRRSKLCILDPGHEGRCLSLKQWNEADRQKLMRHEPDVSHLSQSVKSTSNRNFYNDVEPKP